MPPINPQHMPQHQVLVPQPVTPVIVKSRVDPDEAKNFRSPEDSQATQSPESLPDSTTPEIDKLGSGLFTWVKGAVSTGILQQVAEKAKSSVDSMITILDPQMKEYLTYAAAKQRIADIRSVHSELTNNVPVIAVESFLEEAIADSTHIPLELTNNVPVVAVESFLQEAIADKWYDVALLVLTQPSLGVELHAQSQGTPAVTGVPRRELLVLAARSLAGSYKRLLAVSAAEI
ncbi:Protein PRRC1 [Operophtera brumata]|uniref:Protein PRRC1 n=1 Tax=Operophtera brumata TaxID=104452 RepID=A0A0L7LAD2_OPEBR|nr:Protein PRRC1 [Operophtera brumata]